MHETYGKVLKKKGNLFKCYELQPDVSASYFLYSICQQTTHTSAVSFLDIKIKHFKTELTLK